MPDLNPNLDPLATADLKAVVARSGIPRSTIYKLLAEDHVAGTPGRRFPKPLEGKKMRWHCLAFVKWFENYHAGERS